MSDGTPSRCWRETAKLCPPYEIRNHPSIPPNWSADIAGGGPPAGYWWVQGKNARFFDVTVFTGAG